jgi:HK97 family phage portal protein
LGFFDSLKKNREDKRRKIAYAKMMNGYSPIFSQFGDDIYVSDIVQSAIRCITTEMSKLNPQHIRTDSATGLQTNVNSDIGRLLKFGPNPLMTTSDFMEKITYLREINKNAYIYPTYNKINNNDGTYTRQYTGLYPLNPLEVEYLEDETGRLFIRFTFADGEPYTFPYSDIIHWRKDFTANDFSGGTATGQADNRSLLKLLSTEDTIIQGLDKGVKAALTIKGIIKVNTMMSDDNQEKEREKFEKKMMNMQNGILPLDLKSDYIPININPKVIDKDTIEFLDKRVLINFGVPLKIFNGDFTEEEYQAFYEKTLESMVISLGRCFSKALFTDRELQFGNEIIFYSQGLMFTNMKNKIAAVDVLSNVGALKDNEILAIFGYPPFEGGEVRHMSLNYINRDIADRYQLSKTKTGGAKEINE